MISFLKRADPVTLQRSPMFTKRAPAPACSTFESSMSGRNHHRFEPGEQCAGLRGRDGARRAIAHRPGNCGDVLGSRPAAAADNVHEPVLSPVADLGGGVLRRLVIFAKLV